MATEPEETVKEETTDDERPPWVPPIGCGSAAAIGFVAVVFIVVLLPSLIEIDGPRPRPALTEISDIEAALANFKGKFNMFPPSRITLHEQAAGWQSDARSRAFIRQMWPQFDFSIDQDINGDGELTDLQLTGAECLVFFLGGFRGERGMQGYSKHPSQPLATRGGNREGPYFEFDMGRLVDVDNDGFFEYVDPLPNQKTPYAYASSYDGRGYQPGDLAVFGPGDPRNLSDVYRQPGPEGKPFKENSYQLISPGPDGKYGRGGVFDPNDPSRSLNAPDREDERDNVTNFFHGLLLR